MDTNTALVLLAALAVIFAVALKVVDAFVQTSKHKAEIQSDTRKASIAKNADRVVERITNANPQAQHRAGTNR
jgi:hypothetical protein